MVWGKDKFGNEVELLEIGKEHGLKAQISTYGATIVKLELRKKNGSSVDIVLGFDDLESYLEHGFFCGCIIGRYANRIAQASFSLDGKTYTLAANHGKHNLHGGVQSFSRKNWRCIEHTANSVKLSYSSPHLEEGFPGNLEIEIEYKIEGSQFIIRNTAHTDSATVVNLCNHSYFNLDGGTGDVLNHELQIFSDRILNTDADMIPSGTFRNISHSAFDFQKPKRIGKDLNDPSDKDLKKGQGYDHCYVVDLENPSLKKHAEVYSAASNILLKVSDTRPAVQLYTANFLENEKGKNAQIYHKHQAFCLESQHLTNSVNIPTFPDTTIRAGEVYEHISVWEIIELFK
jgi:aldose 1-epimerase